jgi:neutral ceramidase
MEGEMIRTPTPRWRTRIVRGFVVLIVLFVIIVGPWPANNGTYVGSDYQRTTLARLGAMHIAPAHPAPLRIGVAEVDITPADGIGHELAGYANQPTKEARAIFSRVFARALTIESSDTHITILAVDLLSMHPRMVRAILERTGLAAEDIYFTASHTHSGPGEWGSKWYEEFALGAYDEAYFNTLANQLASVITQSREALVPAEVGVAVARAPHLLRARIDGINEADDRIVAVAFRDATSERGGGAPPLAVLVTYAAHPTASGRDDLRMSADYPGATVDRLRELTGTAHVLFAAGAVGDAAPVPPGHLISCEGAQQMGAALAELIAPQIAAAQFDRQSPFASVRLAVDMPPLRVPLTNYLQSSRVLTSIVDQRQTYMHVLRVGPVVLAGMPCDFSGGAARPFIEWAEANDLVAITTSFNGDYHGYFMSSREFFNCPKLEQRATFMRGPWIGEYFADLAVRVGAQLHGDAPP